MLNEIVTDLKYDTSKDMIAESEILKIDFEIEFG